jgi:hypothetical protein
MHTLRSASRGLGKILSELTRRGDKISLGIVRRGKSKLSAFDVPPNATVAPASRIQETIDEER